MQKSITGFSCVNKTFNQPNQILKKCICFKLLICIKKLSSEFNYCMFNIFRQIPHNLMIGVKH